MSEEGALALMSGWTGLDFGSMAPDQVVRFTGKANAQTSALEAFTTGDPDRTWTVRDIARHAAIGGRGPVVIGSAEAVAEELRSWVEETDVDGFNLAYALTPGTFADIADLVVPELQARGLFKHDYAAGTFREKLFGRGPPPAIQPSGGGGAGGALIRALMACLPLSRRGCATRGPALALHAARAGRTVRPIPITKGMTPP